MRSLSLGLLSRASTGRSPSYLHFRLLAMDRRRQGWLSPRLAQRCGLRLREARPRERPGRRARRAEARRVRGATYRTLLHPACPRTAREPAPKTKRPCGPSCGFLVLPWLCSRATPYRTRPRRRRETCSGDLRTEEGAHPIHVSLGGVRRTFAPPAAVSSTLRSSHPCHPRDLVKTCGKPNALTPHQSGSRDAQSHPL